MYEHTLEKIGSIEMDNANEIIPGIWIGDKIASVDADWLRSHNIQTVFNCTKDLPFHSMIKFQYRVPVDDNLQPLEINNMETWASEIAYKILREYNAGHSILIHCHAGRQRSTTACTFFLMILSGRPLIHVMNLIRSKRRVAFFPTANFATALKGFEKLVHAFQLRT